MNFDAQHKALLLYTTITQFPMTNLNKMNKQRTIRLIRTIRRTERQDVPQVYKMIFRKTYNVTFGP